jgi:hypothetical protein
MVQIIPNRHKSFSEQMLEGVNAAAPALQQFLQEQNMNSQREVENQALKKKGIDLSGISDPEARKQAISYALQGINQERLQGLKSQEKAHQLAEENESEIANYDMLKKTFGEKFANIWKAAPVGGKTELLKSGIDAKLRGENLNKLLSDYDLSEISPEDQSIPENIPQMKEGKVPKDFKWPEISKRPLGTTPKDWAEEKKSWRKENAPIFESTRTRLKNNIRDSIEIKKLEKLNKSKKLPEGFERFLINPETGDFYSLVQAANVASPEAQEWIKITSRFQNRAKDAFGSRVTNFDLQSYMKQFPGLLNTPEGRSRIIRMMDINNKMDRLYDGALDQVYKKYGLSGVSQENADELSKKMIESETGRLEDEYLHLDELNQMEEKKESLSGKMIDVIGPDGQEYEIDQSEVGLLPEGFRIR